MFGWFKPTCPCDPTWAQHLRWTPRSVFKEGLRFLTKTGDSTFTPVRLRVVRDGDE
jgi:hypothetical protein